MNMKTNKKLRLFGLLMALMAVGSLKGQDILAHGFAGDSPLYVMSSEEEPYYAYVQLGSAEEERRTNDKVQYFWEIGLLQPNTNAVFVDGPGGIPDLSQNTKVRPWVRLSSSAEHHRGTFVFRCYRSSGYGHQRGEAVMVYLSDCPEIISIQPKPGYGCWNDGDVISMDQFDVEMFPPSYADRVQLADNSRIASNLVSVVLIDDNQQELNFLIDNEPSDYVLPITVAKTTWQDDVTGLKFDRKLLLAINVLKETELMANKLEAITTKIKSKTKLLAKNKTLKFNFNPFINCSFGYMNSCCNGSLQSLGHLHGSMGIACELSAHVRLGATPFFGDFGFQGSFEVAVDDLVLSTQEGCGEVAIPISLDIGAFCGISLDPLDNPDLFSASIKAIGGATGVFNIYTTSQGWGVADWDLYIKIDAEFIYLVGRSHFSYTVVD